MNRESKRNDLAVMTRVGAVMVVGGGIGGIQASLDLAASGYRVYLVESSPSIGGTMARLDKTFPTNDCSMCILSPKLVECGRHLNITVMTQSEVLGLSGKAGNFTVHVRSHSRYINPLKCTGCGDCAEACPVEFDDEFNAGLVKRKAIYRPFPQAFPNTFCIEKREKAPCATGCPGGINIQGFVALISKKKYSEALRLIRESMAFPSVCGRVCHHPCELVCKRGDYDSPLSIMALKRFVADKCGAEDLQLPEAVETRPERIAIVGAGPAGLTAAFELSKRGYPVDVFEALSEPGGMLAVGIPDYRLPRDVLKREIDRIRQMGVTIKTGVELGKDITITSLKKDGYKAILLAIGAHKSLKLGIEGEDLDGVMDCVVFLRNVNLGNNVKIGRNVIVVGGGNAAIDSARVARRLSDGNVTILYRRTRKEMPATPEEIQAALDEGIKIRFLAAPISVKGNGKVTELVCRQMKLGAPDDSGRRRPVPVPDSEFSLPVDTLIPAISQTSDLSFSSRLHSTKWGSIETQPESSSTNIAGVFACGDAVVGPSTVIDSIAAGKNAALEIHSVLSGELLPKNNRPANEPRHYKDPDFVGESRRVVADAVAAHERVKSFCEVEHVLSEEDAVAESMRCLSCGGCSECMQCVEACKAGAIEHNRADDVVDLNVGAIVLAPGFKEFDASRKFDFGYSRSQNIVSSMEFERMLSSSGPYSGHIMRPSDKQPIHKLAFIQCVGSRDKKCGNEYCSSVCCMYAVKEAVIAKEHDAKVESAIYYMDMRAHGKDFDKYVERAKNEYGVLFKRSRVYSVEEESSSGSIVVSYESENGVFTQDRFDLCVLSVGLEPNDDLAKLAERLGIECNSYGFLRTDNLRPIDTTADGIYVCGVGSGPKDIPETVLQASAASARAGMLLGNSVRGTLTKKKIYPPETDVSYIGPRIGVFVCHCGINIGGIVNVPSVVEYARTLRNVTYVEDNVYTCSQDTQDRIRNLIHEHKLNRVVVASCSPRTHESLFQETVREAGLNPHLFEMANIRDQCSWVHMNDKDAATSKAKDLVRMAVAKVRGAKPLTPIMLDVNHRALVLGGGLAGMTAALAIAEQGFEVDLVEKTSTLGGNLAKLTRDSDGQDLQAFLRDLIARVRGNGRIKVRTKSFIKHVAGFLGNYETVVETRVGKKTVTDKIAHGVAVIAIGGNESVPSEYGYGRNKNILTQLELEQKFKSSRFRPPKTVVMIQCVGSREPEHMYCSKVCCVQALRNALRIKALRPDTEVFILYRDIRAYGFHELEYKRAREAGTLFARFDIDSKPTVRRVGRQLKVTVNDKLLGDELVISADLLVLSSRIDPNTDATELASMFKIPLMEDGFFLEAHAKLRPVDFATEGIYVCGLAHYPKNASESIAQALAAAGRAVTILAKDQIEAEGKISYVIEDRCSGCGACVEVCAYNAIELDPVRRVAVVNQGLCKGCGACAATCRTAAIDLRGFRDAQMLNVIDNI